MIVLALGKKGSGKSAVIRKLTYQRLSSPRKPLIFYHDPGCQISGGALFTDVDQARASIAAGSMPQLSVFRGCEVDDVARLALDVQDATLVVDEMDRACREKRWVSENVRTIVHEGRHHRVDLFGTFRSTRNVSEDLLGQSDYVFLHRTTRTSPYDLQTIGKRFGENYAAAVQNLQPMQFVVWTDDD